MSATARAVCSHCGGAIPYATPGVVDGDSTHTYSGGRAFHWRCRPPVQLVLVQDADGSEREVGT